MMVSFISAIHQHVNILTLALAPKQHCAQVQLLVWLLVLTNCTYSTVKAEITPEVSLTTTVLFWRQNLTDRYFKTSSQKPT